MHLGIDILDITVKRRQPYVDKLNAFCSDCVYAQKNKSVSVSVTPVNMQITGHYIRYIFFHSFFIE